MIKNTNIKQSDTSSLSRKDVVCDGNHEHMLYLIVHSCFSLRKRDLQVPLRVITLQKLDKKLVIPNGKEATAIGFIFWLGERL